MLTKSWRRTEHAAALTNPQFSWSAGWKGGLLAAGTCGSDEQSGVGLDDDVDWFLRFLMTVLRV